MFDLEQEIKKWLAGFKKHQAFDYGAMREMELHLRDHIEDLVSGGLSEQESFATAVKEFGEVSDMAREEFRNQRRKTMLPAIAPSITKASEHMAPALLRSFYITAIRHFFRNRSYAAINISGLAIGITGFVFISLYIINELGYDRFHKSFQNIYRVSNMSVSSAGTVVDAATAHEPLANRLLTDYPEVNQSTRLVKGASMIIGSEGEYYGEEKILFADSNFFRVFDFKMINGNPATALVNPRSMVLTTSYAKKYFGDRDPIGHQISVDDDSVLYAITGVVADMPANSHIKFDMLGSINSNPNWVDGKWIGEDVHTYVVLAPDANVQAFEKKIQDVMMNYVGPEIEFYTGQAWTQYLAAGNRPSYYLIALKDIHLRSRATRELEPGGNISYIFIYALIGCAILFIAIFNFVNLATVESTSRAKEVGVRKVIGSSKAALIYQFMFESVMVSLLATLLAAVLVWLLTPAFTQLVGKDLGYSLTSGYGGMLGLFILAIVVGLIAGTYPAFILANFQPVAVLKGTFNKSIGSGWMRRSLVVTQFSASIIIIIVTLVVYNQLEFMLSQNLGFDKDQILVIRRSELLKWDLDAFENDLLLNSHIQAVANSSTIPGRAHTIRGYRHANNPQENHLFSFSHVSYNYQETMGLQLVSGRFFSKDFGSNSKAVVINESAAKALGYADPVGRTLTSSWHRGELLEIVGVIKDFNFESLHKKIGPLAMEMLESNTRGFITVRISNSQDIQQTVKHVEEMWSKHSNGKPFEAFFFDVDYENLYKSEFATGQVFVVFAGLSIFIACLGLIGLFAFTISVREKEIGIRKILGAGSRRLINLLSGELVRLIIVATLVSWPLAYLATDYWLQNFTYRLAFSPTQYLLSTAVVAAICAAAISYQILKAVSSNPVDSLRNE